MINNAGYSLAGGVEETSVEEARQLFETNFFGVLRVTQAVLPSTRQYGYGRIVDISSMLGLLPGPYRGIYAASKHALGGIRQRWITKLGPLVFAQRWSSPMYTKTEIAKNEKSV